MGSGNDPCITQLQTVVEKGFTNVLEVRYVHAKKPFCVTITITAFLIDQCPYTTYTLLLLLRIKKHFYGLRYILKDIGYETTRVVISVNKHIP